MREENQKKSDRLSYPVSRASGGTDKQFHSQ